MTTATHALCARCNSFQPVIWTPIVIEEVHTDGEIGRFEGLDVKCRNCQFEITQVGVVSHRALGGSK